MSNSHFDQRDLSCLRLHEQLLHLIKLQEAFAKDPFVTHFDDCGYSHATVREPEYTELKAHTVAFRSAFEVHRLLFDEEYRNQYINTPKQARDLTVNRNYSQEAAVIDRQEAEFIDSLRKRGIDERSIAGEDEIALSRKNSEITSDLLVKPHNQQQKGNL